MINQPYTEAERQESARRRDEALEDHERRSKERLETVRDHARHLYSFRAKVEGEDAATVNADDVRKFCTRKGIEVGPWLGSVFRGKNWEHVGWTHSADPKQHATGLRTWRYIGEKDA